MQREGGVAHPPLLGHISEPHRQTHFVASSSAYSQHKSFFIRSHPVTPMGDLAITTAQAWHVRGHPKLRPTCLLVSL